MKNVQKTSGKTLNEKNLRILRLITMMKNAHIFSINYSDLNSVSNNLHCKLIKQNLIVRVDVHRKFYMNVK